MKTTYCMGCGKECDEKCLRGGAVAPFRVVRGDHGLEHYVSACCEEPTTTDSPLAA